MMILAVFRSRTHSLDFAERLNVYGVPSRIVAMSFCEPRS